MAHGLIMMHKVVTLLGKRCPEETNVKNPTLHAGAFPFFRHHTDGKAVIVSMTFGNEVCAFRQP